MEMTPENRFLEKLEQLRNVPIEENGCIGHTFDIYGIIELLRANRDEAYFFSGLKKLATFAPRLVLELHDLYADKPFAQEVVALATKASLSHMQLFSILPTDGMPFELPAALEALEKKGRLACDNMRADLAASVMNYYTKFRRIYTEVTDYTEPNGFRDDLQRTKRFFDWAKSVNTPPTTVHDAQIAAGRNSGRTI